MDELQKSWSPVRLARPDLGRSQPATVVSGDFIGLNGILGRNIVLPVNYKLQTVLLYSPGMGAEAVLIP
jgi:hypothetical protein